MWAKININSDHYSVTDFQNGKEILRDYEINELPNVSGKKLLHLQCHFGQDTLAWARRGAEVTGVDFSFNAIDSANSLAKKMQIPAKFICSDIFELPNFLDVTFDIVYVSHGSLLHALEYEEGSDPKINFPYFFKEQPTKHEIHNSYADQNTVTEAIGYSWNHP
jgi:SAM-dependent methyltransferase